MLPLIKPIPYLDEAPGSLIIRASQLNGWRYPSQMLAAYAGVKTFDPSRNSVLFTDSQRWNQVTSRLGISSPKPNITCYPRTGHTSRSPIKFHGLTINVRHLRLSKPAICPGCIEDLDYIPDIWDYSLFHVCQKHGFKLVDRCPECGQRLTWNREKLDTCSCGMSLAEWVEHEVPKKAASALEQIFVNRDQSKLDATAEWFDVLLKTLADDSLLTQNGFNNASEAKIVDLIFDEDSLKEHLFRHTERCAELGVHPRVALMHLLGSQSLCINNVAIAVLSKCDQPKSLGYGFEAKTVGLDLAAAIMGISTWLARQLIREKVIPATRASSKGRYSIDLQSINKLLGLQANRTQLPRGGITVAEYVNAPASQKSFSTLIKALVGQRLEYCGTTPALGLKDIMVPPAQNPDTQSQYLKLNQVADLCDCHYENIRFAIHAGILPRVDPATCKGTTIFVYEEQARSFHRQYCFAGAIARNLNLNPTNFAEKVMSFGVKAVSGPGIDGGLTYLFRRDDIDSLDIDRLLSLQSYETKAGRKRQSEGGRKSERFATFTEAAKELHIPLQRVEKLILSGALKPAKSLARQKVVSKKSLRVLTKKLRDPNFIPLDEASKAVGETIHEFRRRWIHTSFIPVTETGIKPLVSRADLSKVIAFKAEFVTAAEAAEKLKVGRTHFSNLEKQYILKVAHILSSPRAKIKFYLRSDIDRLVGM